MESKGCIGKRQTKEITILNDQHAKKVVSDSPGLVDFATGLVIPILNLPKGQMKFFGGIEITEKLR